METKTNRKLTGEQRMHLYDVMKEDFEGQTKAENNLEHYSRHYTDKLGFSIAGSSISEIFRHMNVTYGHCRTSKAAFNDEMVTRLKMLEDQFESFKTRTNKRFNKLEY